MTKLTDAILSQSRAKFRNYKPVPLYKQVLPPALRDGVSTKGEGRKGRIILKTNILVQSYSGSESGMIPYASLLKLQI